MRNFKIKKPIDSLKVPKIKKIRKFLFRFTELLALFVAVSVLFGVIFGPEPPFFGQVFHNLSSALKVDKIEAKDLVIEFTTSPSGLYLLSLN